MAEEMPDWTYEAAEAFAAFMDTVSLSDVALVWIVGAVGTWLLVFVHEIGHAVAAQARGLPVQELVVGQSSDVVVRAGRLTMRLGWRLGNGDVAGFVAFDSCGASWKDTMYVSLAGPLANATLAAALVLATVPLEGSAAIVTWLLAADSLVLAIANLTPRGDLRQPDTVSDGLWIRKAWGDRRSFDAPTTPNADANANAAASVPPPGHRPPLSH